MLIRSLAALLLILFTIPAKAFLIEPMLGYSTGTLDATATSLLPAAELSDSFDIKGPSYGVRAGFEPGNFQLAADYVITAFETSGGTLVEDDKLRMQELALFLGYRFWFMRIYGAAIVSARDLDSEMDGTGVKGGLTFYAFKHIGINLEYKKVELTGTTDGIIMDANYDCLTVILSFPFSL